MNENLNLNNTHRKINKKNIYENRSQLGSSLRIKNNIITKSVSFVPV